MGEAGAGATRRGASGREESESDWIAMAEYENWLFVQNSRMPAVQTLAWVHGGLASRCQAPVPAGQIPADSPHFCSSVASRFWIWQYYCIPLRFDHFRITVWFCLDLRQFLS
ncbi:hypothetical protein FYA37_13540 [Bordetella holmesii]|nr:hypothetical protein FYA37_13540 [Bordetella holmesii]